jgi:hypothetical protein
MFVTPAHARHRRRPYVAGFALAAALVLPVGEAAADFSTTAKIFKAEIVQSYAPCTAPTTQTDTGFSACLAPTVTDTGCRFTSIGRGKFKLVASPGDVRVFATAKGIDVSCEGLTLSLVISARMTTNDCPPGAVPGQTCTMVDLADYALGTCTVQRGRCDLNTTFNSGATVFSANNRTSIEVLGCGFVRTTGLGAPVRTFSCGVKVP